MDDCRDVAGLVMKYAWGCGPLGESEFKHNLGVAFFPITRGISCPIQRVVEQAAHFAELSRFAELLRESDIDKPLNFSMEVRLADINKPEFLKFLGGNPSLTAC